MAKQHPILQAITFALLYIVGMTVIDYFQGDVINFDLIKRHLFVGTMVSLAMYFGVFKRQADQKKDEENAG